MVLTQTALKQLSRLGRRDRERIQRAMDLLPQQGDVRRLTGLPNAWRLRVGEWRILWEPDAERRVVQVTQILPRGSAYKP